ncbi:MAG: hypothetical protein H6849_04775 [Alphaproteobacteria bacterium]|nr:MAG: hypothetical protein H6849_04775 [Alphaproteobacteria bacterium]
MNIVWALILTGCASHAYPVPRVTQENYAPDTHAIIVLRTYTIYHKRASHVKTVWAKFDPEYQTTSKIAFTFDPLARGGFQKYIPGLSQIGETLNFPKEANYDVFQIPPGRYLLDWFSSTVAGTRFQTSNDDGWNIKKNQATWAEFEVNPGDLIYLGDIRFYFSQTECGISSKNARDDAEAFIHGHYPWVRKGIEFRPPSITWDKLYQPALGVVEPTARKSTLSETLSKAESFSGSLQAHAQ